VQLLAGGWTLEVSEVERSNLLTLLTGSSTSGVSASHASRPRVQPIQRSLRIDPSRIVNVG